MKIRAIDHGLDLNATDLVRSPGLHMSEIYNDLYQDLEPKRFVRGSLPAPALLAVGTALEQYTERLLLRAGIDATRPDEFRTTDRHSIAFSPDLLIANGIMKGGEIKATFMSMKGWPDPGKSDIALPVKAAKYGTQSMSYGHNLQIPDWIFYIWFLKGKWERGAEELPLAQFRAFHITYTAREMREEYQMLINHAESKGML